MKDLLKIMAGLIAALALAFVMTALVQMFLARNDVRMASSQLEFVTEYPFRGEIHVKDTHGKMYKVSLKHGDKFQYAGGWLTWRPVTMADTVVCRPM